LQFSEVVADGLLAYIDPSLGSTAFQLAIATLLGGLYAIRLYWKNVKRRLFGSREDSDEIARDE